MPALSHERKESHPGKVKTLHESRLEGENSPEKQTKIKATTTHTNGLKLETLAEPNMKFPLEN